VALLEQPAVEQDADAAEALFKEARRRRQRRRLTVITAVLVLLAAGLVAGQLFLPSSKGPNVITSSPLSPQTVKAALHISTLRFPGPFVPQQVVAEGGRIWLLGSTKPQSSTDCALEEVDPFTLKTRSFPLPACAVDIAAGNGQIFLLTDTFVPHTAATRQLRIETFDTRSYHAVVLAPVDLSMIGSAIAHQALTYGGGALWLYGYTSTGGTEVVQISPSSGAVLASTSDVPAIGGVFPAVVANSAGLWLAGGPGGSSTVELIPKGSSIPESAYAGVVHQTSIQWLAGIGNLVWADVATYGSGGTPAATFRLVAFNDSGDPILSSPIEEMGDFPLVATSNSGLWTVGTGTRCAAAQELIEVSGRTGASRVAASLKSPISPCLYGADGSQLASVSRSVFVLDPTDTVGGSLLYRVET
jgi:hypothetical protein